MRTIKFRFWDTRLHPPRFAQDGCFSVFWNPNLNRTESISGDEMNYTIDEIIPPQFTGLLDKNGKEIYEGDIIATKTFKLDELNKTRIITGEIAYMGSGFKLRNRLGRWVFGCVSAVKEDVEIIGNIFENPELLNAK